MAVVDVIVQTDELPFDKNKDVSNVKHHVEGKNKKDLSDEVLLTWDSS